MYSLDEVRKTDPQIADAIVEEIVANATASEDAAE